MIININVQHNFYAIQYTRLNSLSTDEVLDNDSRHSSLDSGLLHPDLAWRDSRYGMWEVPINPVSGQKGSYIQPPPFI